MRTLQVILLSILVSGSTIAQSRQDITTSLRIEVSGTKNNEGTLRFFLFSSEDNFLKQPYMQKTTTADATYVTFDDLPLGTYAVNVYHDKNDNGELDINWLGAPKEAFGFSKNRKGKLGPPKFDEVQITVDNPKNIKIRLN